MKFNSFSAFLLLTIFLLSSCSEPKNIKLEGILNCNGAGEILIGSSIEKTISQIQNVEIKPIHSQGYSIYKENNEIINIWSKHQDSKIGFIKVLSPNYKSEKGLHVGQDVEDIKKIYPNIKLILDETNGEFYIAPKDLQFFDDESPVRLCFFYVEIDEDGNNIDFVLNESKNALEADLNVSGKIKSVLIFEWK